MAESTPQQKRNRQVRIVALSEATRKKLISCLDVASRMGYERGPKGLAEMVLECTIDLPQEMLAESEGISERYKQSLSQKTIARTVARWSVDDITKDVIDARGLALSLVSSQRDRLYTQDT